MHPIQSAANNTHHTLTPVIVEALLNAVGLPATQRAVIGSLLMDEWNDLTAQADRFLAVSVEPEALGEVLQELKDRARRQRAEDETIKRCVALKAPNRFLHLFFGLTRAEMAAFRKLMHVEVMGRTPRVHGEAAREICNAWHASSEGEGDLMRYLTVAERTGFDLRTICTVLMPADEEVNDGRYVEGVA